MSLINDALKKAQKQRTGETPSLASMPSVGGETPHRIAKRSKPAGVDTLIIRAGVGLGALLVVMVGGYFAFRSDAEAKRPAISVQPSASVQPVQPASLPTAQNPAPISPLPVQNTQVSLPGDRPGQTPGLQQQTTVPLAPTFTLPVAPKTEPPAAVTVAAVATPAPVPAGPPPAPAQPTGSDPRVSPFRAQSSTPVSDPQVSGIRSQVSAPSAAPKLEPRAIQYIENIKVAGIMARPTDSKVLMNDRVYRIGSLVEAEMGLTLVGITSNSLTFEDGHGGRYTRTF